jgi:hypothetical protein
MALAPRHKKIVKNDKPFGRDQYLTSFNQKLNNLNDEQYNVLHYFGIGGLGKTTLQKFFTNSLQNNENIVNIFINFEEASTPEKLYSLLGYSLKNKIKLFYFELAYAAYWRKLNPHINLAKSDKDKLVEEGGFMSDILALVDGCSVAGIGGGLFSVANKYAKKINYFLNAEYKDEIEELETMTSSEIETMLPKFLSYDIQEHLYKKEDDIFVFQLDTHEYLWEKIKIESKRLETDIWIRDLILTLQPKHTLFVLTGREKLKWNLEDKEWDSIIDHIPLESFDFKTSTEYLLENGVKEENIRNIIAKESEGIPFYLKLSLETYAILETPSEKDFSLGNNESIFNRFFQYIDKSESSLIKALSLTKNFDKTIFCKIVEHFKIPFSVMDFDYIVDYSFVNKNNDGTYNIHNLMKKSVETKLDSDLKKDIFNFLYNIYNDQIKDIKTVENVTKNTFKLVENAFYYKNKNMAENSVVKWYTDNYESLLSQTDLIHEMKDMYQFVIDTCNKEYYKTKFFIKLGHLYIELGNIKKAEEIVETIESNDFSLNDKDWFELLKIKIIEDKEFKTTNEKKLLSKNYIKLSSEAVSNEVKIISLISAGNIKRHDKNMQQSLSLLLEAEQLINDKTPSHIKIDLFFKLAYFYKDVSDTINFKKYIDKLTLNIDSKTKKSKYNSGLLHRLITENLYKNENYIEAYKEATTAYKLMIESVGEYSSKTKNIQHLFGRIHHKQKIIPELVSENKNELLYMYKINHEELFYKKIEPLFIQSNKDQLELYLVKFSIDKDINILLDFKNKVEKENIYVSNVLINIYKQIIVYYLTKKEQSSIQLYGDELLQKLIKNGQNNDIVDIAKFLNGLILKNEDIIRFNEYILSNINNETIRLNIQYDYIDMLRGMKEYNKVEKLAKKDLANYETYGLYTKLWKCYDYLFNNLRYKQKNKAIDLMFEKIEKMKKLDNKYYILEYSYRKILDLYNVETEVDKRINILEEILLLTKEIKATKPLKYYEPLHELMGIYYKYNKNKYNDKMLDMLEFLQATNDIELSKEFKKLFYSTQKFYKNRASIRFKEIENKYYTNKKK